MSDATVPVNLTRERSSSTFSTFGIGILGLGTIGRRMAQVFDDHPAFRVVAAYDPAPETARSGFPMRPSAEAVVNDPAVDCVYIAAPPSSHLGHVRAVAAAGTAVFCEKPLAVVPAEAHACCEAIRRAGVPAAVNFPFATSWAARQLRHLVNDDALGTIRDARLTLRFARWPRSWQANAGPWLARPEQGGFMREVGSHFIFQACRMFGPGVLESAEVTRTPSGIEQHVKARVRFGEVTLHVDGAIAGNLDDVNRFEVSGERGAAALTDWQRLDYRGKLSERVNSLPHQLEALRLLLSGDEAHGLASPEEGARVAEIVEDILRH